MTHGQPRCADFYDVMDKIQGRLAAWKSKLLNKAGKLCLVKSTISSIPVYSMQSLWLPQAVCNKIDQACRRMLWAKSDNTRFWSLVSWEVVTQPKELGGLGVREARRVNVSLLGKLVWDMLSAPQKPWVHLLSNLYLHGNSILCAQTRRGASPIWSSIIKALPSLREGFQPYLGSGASSLLFTLRTPTKRSQTAGLVESGTSMPCTLSSLQNWFTQSNRNQVRADRRLAESGACSRCSCPRETILHALRDCPYSREVLMNNMLFNGELWQVSVIRQKVLLSTVENSVYNAKRRLGVEQALWRPPEHPWVKLNTDGSWLSGTAAVGMGGAIRDWAGGFRKVSCECDCLGAVTLFQDRSPDRDYLHKHYDVIRRVKRMLAWDWVVYVSHIPQEINSVAHTLANWVYGT
uniref:Ribonuclease H protein At1g65750 family n=1 Tax=Cajanus cajan TaxID=3821 RepID=A0A151SRC7_CAJCA|nr:Putative ribonuclease H protein At1g65750 family [Cajanus cajan]